MNWKNIEVPLRMRDLPKDNRGYPIPFTILRDSKGLPDFRRHDATLAGKSILHKICSICGHPLASDIWFISGVRIALEPRGGYIDPPVHKQCGTYALRVCPYLAVPSFSKRLTNEGKNVGKSVQVMPGKPVVFAFTKTIDYQVIQLNNAGVILPVRPFLDIEFWREGMQITWSQAKRLLK